MAKQWIAAAAAMMVAGAASADDYVNRADVNGDGYVSLHELRAAYFADPAFNRRIEQSFAAYDRNGDGLISAAERRDFRAASSQAASGATAQSLQIAPDLGGREGQNSASDVPGRNEEQAARNRSAGSGSRFDAWVKQLDADNSGGASAAELLASGGGQRWFTDREFSAADRNENGELEADELELLVQSLERRQR